MDADSRHARPVDETRSPGVFDCSKSPSDKDEVAVPGDYDALSASLDFGGFGVASYVRTVCPSERVAWCRERESNPHSVARTGF